MTDRPASDFDPVGILRVLSAHRVKHVVIGGVAARILGSPTLTRDLDICYDRAPTNLRRLASALIELGATLRGAPAGLPFRLDARTLARGDAFTFSTGLGPLDVMGEPAGTAGYEELARTAVRSGIGGVTVLSASIDDLVRMKRAAGRTKDRIELEVLAALRDELDAGDGSRP